MAWRTLAAVPEADTYRMRDRLSRWLAFPG
jgi:hypothetical protein